MLTMATTGRRRGLVLLMILGGLSLFMILGGYTVLQEVNAGAITYSVAVAGARPTIGTITCCFKSYDDTPASFDCDGSFVMSEAENYDMVCNFTVTDTNGYQDMVAGTVNVSWYNPTSGGTWTSTNSNDNKYVNTSCRNITGTWSGNDIDYECGIYGLKYWADGGVWTILVNSTDGTDAGVPGTNTMSISNLTTGWSQASIGFGTMSLGTNGSQWRGGYVNVSSISNNTGNTRVNMQVQSGAATLTCSVAGSIACTDVEYDVVFSTTMDAACGQLTTSQEWDAGCPQLKLRDCSGTCGTLPINYTYWGITIPTAGVGGTCQLSVTPYYVQGYN